MVDYDKFIIHYTKKLSNHGDVYAVGAKKGRELFYIGKFIYSGVIYDGKHEPIIEVTTFNRVQKMFN